MAGNLRSLTPVERKLVLPLVGKTMLELGNKRNDRGVYKAAFEASGFVHTSVDLNGKDGAVRKDLQRPLKLGRFDMVTNFGTTEHVAEQEPAWRNIIEAAGSVVVSTTPAPGSWLRHGKWYPTEEFYVALARLNGFVIRVVIKTIRRIIDMLLQSHQSVHVVMASGNHDPASSAWLREMLAAMYENEPRISIDNSPSLYYSFEWGQTGLYYHHMHKRDVKDIDRTFAGMFREMFGRCRYNYGHGGHRHSDQVIETPLMIIERHQTLAAPDAYAAGGGWLSGRSAKRISYSREFGEVGRDTLRPEMVMGAARMQAANDNEPQRRVA